MELVTCLNGEVDHTFHNACQSRPSGQYCCNCRVHSPKDQLAGRGLAATGLTDQAERFTAGDGEAHVVDGLDVADGFVENDWIGRTLAIGEQVLLKMTGRCPRCVMTTLGQGDLPNDPGILRTAVQQNEAHVGVYAEVVSTGTIRRGDTLRTV